MVKRTRVKPSKRRVAGKRASPDKPPARAARKVTRKTAPILAPQPRTAPAPPRQASAIDPAAREYLRLCFRLAHHDPSYIETYFGSPQLRDEATAGQPLPLSAITTAAGALNRSLATLKTGRTKAELTRRRHLQAAVQALAARAAMLAGKKMSFDREALACFGVTPPKFTDAFFRKSHRQLEAVLPGKGTLAERLAGFDDEFRVIRERLRDTLYAAVNEARRRTQRYFTLPAHEQFRLEFVADRPWVTFGWYAGSARSVVQVNTDQSFPLAGIVQLATRDGYPGRHTRQCRAETDWFRQRGWLEHSIETMYSPRCLMAAGLADAAASVVFPGNEGEMFERRVIAQLAGFVPHQMEHYHIVQRARNGLAAAASCEAGRRLIDGKMNIPQALPWLAEAALLPREQAAQRLGFIEHFRSYCILDAVGGPLVGRWLDRKGGSASKPLKRWALFVKLLAEPLLPGDLL